MQLEMMQLLLPCDQFLRFPEAYWYLNQDGVDDVAWMRFETKCSLTAVVNVKPLVASVGIFCEKLGVPERHVENSWNKVGREKMTAKIVKITSTSTPIQKTYQMI